MKDEKIIKEIVESNQNCANKLDQLIADLKIAGIDQETINKTTAMKSKYQDIADYNNKLIGE